MADKFNSPIDIPEVSSSPAAPTAGYSRIYSKTDGKVYKKNAAGVEVELTNAAGTGLTDSDKNFIIAMSIAL